jgi:hypothetical protein
MDRYVWRSKIRRGHVGDLHKPIVASGAEDAEEADSTIRPVAGREWFSPTRVAPLVWQTHACAG